jgi:hypothetical protein
LLDYLRRETNLTFAAQALFGILPKEQALGELLKLFAVYPPDDHRSAEQKRQLVLILADEEDARILPTLVPYLLDHSDDVRDQVLELFFARAQKHDPVASGADVLANVAQLVRENEASPRIAKKAAEVASTLEWMLPGSGEVVNPALNDDFFIDKKGYVRRRPAKVKGP